MIRSKFCLVACGVGLLLFAGCIEQSIVIKTDKDGSGVVHVRNHSQEVVMPFGASKDKKESDEKSKLPSPDRLEELVAKMGSGVELVSATDSTNRNGWKGFELVFRFEDINKLVIPSELMSAAAEKDDEDDAESSDAGETSPALIAAKAAEQNDDLIDQNFRFTLTDGELQIHTELPALATSKQSETEKIGAVDPFADQPPARKNMSISLGSNAMMEKVLAKALSDMRLGIFVQIDGEIESTNAIHRKENLITLISLNLGQILDSPDAKKHMEKLTKLKQSPQRREQTQQIAELIDGLNVDLQDPIVVKIRYPGLLGPASNVPRTI